MSYGCPTTCYAQRVGAGGQNPHLRLGAYSEAASHGRWINSHSLGISRTPITVQQQPAVRMQRQAMSPTITMQKPPQRRQPQASDIVQSALNMNTVHYFQTPREAFNQAFIGDISTNDRCRYRNKCPNELASRTESSFQTPQTAFNQAFIGELPTNDQYRYRQKAPNQPASGAARSFQTPRKAFNKAYIGELRTGDQHRFRQKFPNEPVSYQTPREVFNQAFIGELPTDEQYRNRKKFPNEPVSSDAYSYQTPQEVFNQAFIGELPTDEQYINRKNFPNEPVSSDTHSYQTPREVFNQAFIGELPTGDQYRYRQKFPNKPAMPFDGIQVIHNSGMTLPYNNSGPEELSSCFCVSCPKTSEQKFKPTTDYSTGIHSALRQKQDPSWNIGTCKCPYISTVQKKTYEITSNTDDELVKRKWGLPCRCPSEHPTDEKYSSTECLLPPEQEEMGQDQIEGNGRAYKKETYGIKGNTDDELVKKEWGLPCRCPSERPTEEKYSSTESLLLPVQEEMDQDQIEENGRTSKGTTAGRKDTLTEVERGTSELPPRKDASSKAQGVIQRGQTSEEANAEFPYRREISSTVRPQLTKHGVTGGKQSPQLQEADDEFPPRREAPAAARPQLSKQGGMMGERSSQLQTTDTKFPPRTEISSAAKSQLPKQGGMMGDRSSQLQTTDAEFPPRRQVSSAAMPQLPKQGTTGGKRNSQLQETDAKFPPGTEISSAASSQLPKQGGMMGEWSSQQQRTDMEPAFRRESSSPAKSQVSKQEVIKGQQSSQPDKPPFRRQTSITSEPKTEMQEVIREEQSSQLQEADKHTTERRKPSTYESGSTKQQDGRISSLAIPQVLEEDRIRRERTSTSQRACVAYTKGIHIDKKDPCGWMSSPQCRRNYLAKPQQLTQEEVTMLTGSSEFQETNNTATEKRRPSTYEDETAGLQIGITYSVAEDVVRREQRSTSQCTNITYTKGVYIDKKDPCGWMPSPPCRRNYPIRAIKPAQSSEFQGTNNATGKKRNYTSASTQINKEDPCGWMSPSPCRKLSSLAPWSQSAKQEGTNLEQSSILQGAGTATTDKTIPEGKISQLQEGSSTFVDSRKPMMKTSAAPPTSSQEIIGRGQSVLQGITVTLPTTEREVPDDGKREPQEGLSLPLNHGTFTKETSSAAGLRASKGEVTRPGPSRLQDIDLAATDKEVPDDASTELQDELLPLNLETFTKENSSEAGSRTSKGEIISSRESRLQEVDLAATDKDVPDDAARGPQDGLLRLKLGTSTKETSLAAGSRTSKGEIIRLGESRLQEVDLAATGKEVPDDVPKGLQDGLSAGPQTSKKKLTKPKLQEIDESITGGKLGASHGRPPEREEDSSRIGRSAATGIPPKQTGPLSEQKGTNALEDTDRPLEQESESPRATSSEAQSKSPNQKEPTTEKRKSSMHDGKPSQLVGDPSKEETFTFPVESQLSHQKPSQTGHPPSRSLPPCGPIAIVRPLKQRYSSGLPQPSQTGHPPSRSQPPCGPTAIIRPLKQRYSSGLPQPSQTGHPPSRSLPPCGPTAIIRPLKQQCSSGLPQVPRPFRMHQQQIRPQWSSMPQVYATNQQMLNSGLQRPSPMPELATNCSPCLKLTKMYSSGASLKEPSSAGALKAVSFAQCLESQKVKVGPALRTTTTSLNASKGVPVSEVVPSHKASSQPAICKYKGETFTRSQAGAPSATTSKEVINQAFYRQLPKDEQWIQKLNEPQKRARIPASSTPKEAFHGTSCGQLPTHGPWNQKSYTPQKTALARASPSSTPKEAFNQAFRGQLPTDDQRTPKISRPQKPVRAPPFATPKEAFNQAFYGKLPTDDQWTPKLNKLQKPGISQQAQDNRETDTTMKGLSSSHLGASVKMFPSDYRLLREQPRHEVPDPYRDYFYKTIQTTHLYPYYV